MAKAKEPAKTPQALPEGALEAVPKKKSRVKRFVIIFFILLMTLTGAGAGAYWWLYMRQPASPEAEKDMPPESGHPSPGNEAGAGGKGADAKTPPDAKDGGARVERQTSIPRSAGVVLPLPFVKVNLADGGGRRYLKLGMEVEANRNITDDIKRNEARIRDAVIMLLAGKSFSELSSPEGKILLKAEVAGRLNQILGSQCVIRVYFTDFVVE
ncbi:MAG: flagellar basal body-associated FliL family protein [Desulfovibrio sp.]|nr:flagellar basal body-associated FliL family protein [Desulfovibrio sp.]